MPASIEPIAHEIRVYQDDSDGVFVEIVFYTRDNDEYSFIFRPEVFRALHDDMEQVT